MARRPMSTPFVARETEVATLTDALRRAADGEPSLVLVGADAGVGKTRLLTHLAEIAQRSGALAVTGHCIDLGEVGLPYLPFTEALGLLRADARVRDAVDEVLASRPALARLLPGAAADPAPAHDEDQAGRLQLFDGVAAALAAAGRPGAPLLLVVEDLHWADPSTRDVLRYLLTRMRDEHVLVVTSYRSDDLHRTHPLRPFLAELWRHPRVVRLDLAPFAEHEMRRFATAVAGHPLPERDLRSVLERSEGNAYFAEELIEAGPTETLPWSLAEVLRSRLEQLDPDVQALARLTSVAGRTVPEALLRAVHAEAHGAGGPLPDLDRLLREAVTGHVLTGEGDRISFRHALLAEAVYADLLPGEQVRLHRAYRDVLAADPSLGSHAGLAVHALACHDLPTALAASVAAAADAGAVYAPAERLRHLQTALRLWDSVPDAEAVAGLDRVTVLRRAALAAAHLGEVDRALQLVREAIVAAGDDLVARARHRSLLARFLLAADDGLGAFDEIEGALAELPADAPARERAWAHAVHARVCLNIDRDADATRSAEQALAAAEEAGDDPAAADALATLAVLSVDEPDRVAELLTEAAARARTAGDVTTELRCVHNLASTYYYAGRLDDARRTIDDGLARAGEVGMEFHEHGGGLRFFGVLTHYMQGDLTPPEPYRGPRLGTFAEIFDAISLYSAVARGDEDAIARGEALRPMWAEDTEVALLSGGPTIDALTWAGRFDEAATLADALIDHVVRNWDDFFLGGIWLAALGLAALADGAAHDRLTGVDPTLRVRHGDELLQRAITTAERGRPRGGRLGPEGRAWLARAHAEHARLTGRHDVDLWRRATEEFGYGYRYEEARSRWRWAEALVEAGRRDEAAAQLAAATAVAREIGAKPLLAATEDLGRRARLTGVRTSSAADVLTQREAEVLTLVAEGLSNRQIGERLFISGKTVSVHVSNLLAKLGASTRAEAVTLAHRRGLLADVHDQRADA